jgi:hypothetical protein
MSIRSQPPGEFNVLQHLVRRPSPEGFVQVGTAEGALVSPRWAAG